MFSTLYGSYFPFQMLFEMSTAICFNLDQSNILSCGNGLRPGCTEYGDNEHISIGECNTILSAYTLYRHLG